MRLKVLTTALLITGVLLMLGWPFIVGSRPPRGTPKPEIARWGVRSLVYFGATSGVWLSAAVSAMLLAKKTKKEFLDQERKNLKDLIEGTLQDHGKRP